MKIVEATWEKRNLGIKVLEVEIELNDEISIVIEDIDELTADYIVVKVPTKISNLIGPIQLAGFEFIEVLTHSIFDTKLPTLDKLEERFLLNLHSSPISDSNRRLLESSVLGGMFNTDRISLDSKFDQFMSANRYLGMISDECSKGAAVYEITYKDDFVGFYVLRLVSETTSLSSIGGVLPQYQNKGIGVLMNYLQIMNSYKLGANQVLSTFSSNNVAATIIHWKYAYRLAKQEYVFIKHLH